MLSDGARPNHRTSIVNQPICSHGAEICKLAAPFSPVNPGRIGRRGAPRRGGACNLANFCFRVKPRDGGRAGSAPGRNRTFNLGIKSPLLCQLSYRRRVPAVSGRAIKATQKFVDGQPLDEGPADRRATAGRGVSDGSRTRDLQGHNLAL